MTDVDRGKAEAGFRAFRWPDLEGEYAASVQILNRLFDMS